MGTYTLVGDDPGWIVAFMPLPAVVVFCFMRWKTGLRPVARPWYLAPVLWFLVCSLLAVPMEWIIGGACVLFAAFTATWKRKTLLARPGVSNLELKNIPNHYRALRPIARIVFPVVFLTLGAFIGLMMPLTFREKVTISPTTVNFISSYKNTTVPLKGLTVHVSKDEKRWWNIRSWHSWDTYEGRVWGPNFAGFDMFWGPDGLIRGDELGKRLAKLAETSPGSESTSLQVSR
jgi:hypothetical protein